MINQTGKWRILLKAENLLNLVVAIVAIGIAVIDSIGNFLPGGAIAQITLGALGVLSMAIVAERIIILYQLDAKLSFLTDQGGHSYLHMYETRDELPGYPRFISTARDEILIVGINSETTIGRYLEHLRPKLEVGCQVKFLLMNPRVNSEISPMVVRTAKTIGRDPVSLFSSIEQNLDRLVKFRSTLSKQASNRLSIQVYDVVGTFAFLSVDGFKSYGKILISMYPYGIDSSDFWPCLEFRPSGGKKGMYEFIYERHKHMFADAALWVVK